MPAPTNAAQSGRKVVFAVEMTAGTYVPVLSARENSFSMSASEIDTSCKADNQFGSSIAGDIKVTTTLTGPYRNTPEDKFLRAAFLTQEPISARFVTSNEDMFTGYFTILKYDVSGSKGGAEEFTLDLTNYGEITYTPAP